MKITIRRQTSQHPRSAVTRGREVEVFQALPPWSGSPGRRSDYWGWAPAGLIMAVPGVAGSVPRIALLVALPANQPWRNLCLRVAAAFLAEALKREMASRSSSGISGVQLGSVIGHTGTVDRLCDMADPRVQRTPPTNPAAAHLGRTSGKPQGNTLPPRRRRLRSSEPEYSADVSSPDC
jgi:hypothetical protein